MGTQDPQPGSWLHSSLKRDVIEQGRRQRAAWARWDRKLAESQARIDALLAAEREAGLAAARADLAAGAPDTGVSPDREAQPVVGHVPPPTEDVDAIAASSVLGCSPAHMAWRRQHVPQSQPFGL